MSKSFGIVEEKLRESDFFLKKFRTTTPLSYEGKFYFSAFVSAARSLTLSMQACMNGVDGFDDWYIEAVTKLGLNQLAPYFREVRNDIIHAGVNPLNQIPIDHLREYLTQRLRSGNKEHFIIFDAGSETAQIMEAVPACENYFTSLVRMVFDCYQRFKKIVDPKWYFTEENFSDHDKTINDAIVELGFPSFRLPADMDKSAAWPVIRRQQPSCQINDIFDQYLGCVIPDPDDESGNDVRERT